MTGNIYSTERVGKGKVAKQGVNPSGKRALHAAISFSKLHYESELSDRHSKAVETIFSLTNFTIEQVTSMLQEIRWALDEEKNDIEDAIQHLNRILDGDLSLMVATSASIDDVATVVPCSSGGAGSITMATGRKGPQPAGLYPERKICASSSSSSLEIGSSKKEQVAGISRKGQPPGMCAGCGKSLISATETTSSSTGAAACLGEAELYCGICRSRKDKITFKFQAATLGDTSRLVCRGVSRSGAPTSRALLLSKGDTDRSEAFYCEATVPHPQHNNNDDSPGGSAGGGNEDVTLRLSNTNSAESTPRSRNSKFRSRLNSARHELHFLDEF